MKRGAEAQLTKDDDARENGDSEDVCAHPFIQVTVRLLTYFVQ